MGTESVGTLIKKRVSKALKAAKPSAASETDKPVIKKFIEAHGKFAEAYSMGTEFCTLSADNEAIHAFTYCKDFISDIFFGNRFQKAMSIYSFSWSPKTNKAPSLKPAKMLIRDKKLTGMEERAANCQEFLNLAEEALGISLPSKCIALEEHNCVYVESPAMEWTECLPMISLWTLLMRVGFNNYTPKIGKGKTFGEVLDAIVNGKQDTAARDNNRLKTVKSKLSALENREFKITFAPYMFDDFHDAAVGTVHNGSGIISTLGKVA